MHETLNSDHEVLVKKLGDSATREEYKRPYDGYKPSLMPRILGTFLVNAGNLVYGKGPSYLKFRAVEVIARIPYHSWASAAHTLLTLFYRDEKRAIALSKISLFSRLAEDNETMHVVVISYLSKHEQKAHWTIHTAIPLIFAFFYFWAAYWLYLINPRYALELNYLFEQHAFDQYSLFLKENEAALKTKLMESDYLVWYGRSARNQFEFFESVRNDELIHRNRSIHEIELHSRKK